MGKGGIVTRRRLRRARRRRLTGAVLLCACALLAVPVMLGCRRGIPPQLAQAGRWAAAAFSAEPAFVEIELPGTSVYALQLAVYENGERAAAHQLALQEHGVGSVIWQRDKLRIVCSVAASRDALNIGAAAGMEAYVIRDELDAARLRIGAPGTAVKTAADFALLADSLLKELVSGQARPLDQMAQETRQAAKQAETALSGHPLFAWLAENLCAWCDRIEALEGTRADLAGAMIYPICRAWREKIAAQTGAL